MEIDYGFLILSFLVGTVISAIIIRYIFSIDEILKYQKAQTDLLMKIAKAKGVPEEDIKEFSNLHLKKIHEKDE